MSRYRAHSGTCDQILLSVRRLFSESCCLVSVERPLCREGGSAICSVITQWSESLRTRNHTLLSYLRLPQPGGPGSRIYIPQEQGGLVIPPGTRLAWLVEVEVEVTLHLTISQSVSMSRYRAHSETCDQILLPVRKLFSERCCLVSVGRPLRQEVGSSQSVVIYQYLHQSNYVTCVLEFSNLYTI
jgi:hypothetical protein